MDFEMDELFVEPLDDGFDIDYEFDAPRYYDFTRPESDCDFDEAQLWFQTTGSHSPSPMAIKLDGRPSIQVKSGISSFGQNADEKSNTISSSGMNSEVTSADSSFLADSSGSDSYSQGKSLTKSPSSKHSSFMNPTASQLAKQIHTPQIFCERLLRRSQKLVKTGEKSSQNQSVNGRQATKRQKLEAGYLSKVAHLKHQAIFSHKEPKKVRDDDTHVALPKSKVTNAKEPSLGRERSHRSKTNSESSESEKSSICTFRARPLNRKIFETPSLPISKKSTPQPPVFQLFHLRTSQRAMQHSSNNAQNASNFSCSSQKETSSRRVNNVAALKEKLEALDKAKARSLNRKECNSPTEKSFSKEPPTDLFSKLSLTSEVQSTAKSQTKKAMYSKGLKENAPSSTLQKNELKNVAKSQWHINSQLQCGGNEKMSFILPGVNRSLGIR